MRESRASATKARHAARALAARAPRRLVALLVVIVVVFTVIGVRLLEVQAGSARYYASLGADQRVRIVTLAADRGSIFDRNGNDLAISVERSSIFADPRQIEHPIETAARLAPVVGIDEGLLRQQLSDRDRAFVYIARQVEPEVAKKVRALELAGIGFVPEAKRYYPSDPLAAPLVGFVGIDNNGLGGLEAGAERALAGRPGRMRIEQDPQGREIPDGERQVREAQRGSDLVLTLDRSLQFEVERVLTEEVARVGARGGGTAVIADVQTGDILAMASVDGPVDDQPARPTSSSGRNKPLTDVFEPGSTNKVVTIASALEAGLVTPETVLEVPQRLVVDDKEFEDVDAHPTQMTVAEIIRKSSNVGTILIARMLGQQRFDAALREFGFGTSTGLDFPGEAPGILLPLESYNDTSLASMPVGNGIAVTAMQMLDVYQTIANGGVARAPRLVGAVVDANGEREATPLGASRRVISESTAASMRTMLEAVVASGTGTKAQIPGYRVAGKTGTARKPPYEKPPYKYVASFAGFAPANAPKLAAIVVLDEPQADIYGGQVAAPVFARIMQYALALERVPAQ
jgi:cell division protein FtsI (penicillin-binding protein 3)